LRKPLADFVIVVVNKALTLPLSLSIQEHHFLFGYRENIETQYERREWLSDEEGGKRDITHNRELRWKLFLT